MKRAYGWDPVAAQSGLWGTEPLWQAEASLQSPSLSAAGTSYHQVHTDHLATPMVATDKTGVQTWKAISEAFGQMRVDNASAITMNLRLPGQYFDGESGGHYNYHRDYRAELGRYSQRDPIGLRGGINAYAYVEGSPLRYVDPRGQALVLGWCLTPAGMPLCAAGAMAAGAALSRICKNAPGWVQDWMTSDPAGGEGADRPPANPNAPPPDNAYDPNGPKAPGRPGEAEGFEPPKGGDQWVKNPNGRGYGWLGSDGRVWVPTGPEDPSKGISHGGPHWDVQTGGRRPGYENIRPVRP